MESVCVKGVIDLSVVSSVLKGWKGDRECAGERSMSGGWK